MAAGMPMGIGFLSVMCVIEAGLPTPGKTRRDRKRNRSQRRFSVLCSGHVHPEPEHGDQSRVTEGRDPADARAGDGKHADSVRLVVPAGATPGATLGASLAAVRRVTGRVVVFGVAGGEAPITNWDLVYRHQVHIIGLNIGILIQSAPQIFGEVMGELFGLLAAGVLGPGQPAAYDLADGPKALAELEARVTVGKLALRP